MDILSGLPEDLVKCVAGLCEAEAADRHLLKGESPEVARFRVAYLVGMESASCANSVKLPYKTLKAIVRDKANYTFEFMTARILQSIRAGLINGRQALELLELNAIDNN